MRDTENGVGREEGKRRKKGPFFWRESRRGLLERGLNKQRDY